MNKLVLEQKELFIAAIRANEGLIIKIASLYTDTSDDKDDLVQEIIYQLWKSFDSFNQKSKLSTWMYRVALNVAIYHLKIAKRKPRTVSMEEQTFDVPETVSGDAEERWTVLRNQINDLNLLDKAIILLYLEDKNYEEIAEIVGISITNVGTKLSRIKEKLKKQTQKKL